MNKQSQTALDLRQGVTKIPHRKEQLVTNVTQGLGIFRVIKSNRKRWADHVARMIEVRNTYKLLIGKAERKSTRKT